MGAEPRERSRDENIKGRQGGSKGTWRIYQKGRRGGELVTRCGRETWKVCVVHVHNDIKWGNACTGLRSMYMQCLSHKVDLVCGDGNQSWYAVLNHTRLNELMHWETVTQNLSMDLSTQWPVF